MEYTKSSAPARGIAQVTGFSLLLMALIAGFGYGYAFQSLYVEGNEIATVRNMAESGWLYKMTIVSFLGIFILDVIVAWGLYLLFRDTHKLLSLVTAFFRLAYTMILGASIFHLIAAGYFPDGHSTSGSAIMNSLNMFLTTWSFGLIFFGCHLISLGLMIKANRLMPKALSVLVWAAGVCYLLTNVTQLLFPSSYAVYQAAIETALSLPMALGELALAIWLIRNGSRLR